MVYLNFSLSPPPPQGLLFSNSRLQGRSHCLLQIQTLDPQVRAGINTSACRDLFSFKRQPIGSLTQEEKDQDFTILQPEEVQAQSFYISSASTSRAAVTF